MAFNLILANVMIFGIGFAYYKNKLPVKITNAIKFIFNFDVSKKVTSIVFVIMLGIYIFSSIGEVVEEEKGFDFPLVMENIKNWNIDDYPPKQYFFRFFLLSFCRACGTPR